MKITFIGAGYVGLVSGAMLSSLGLDVTCSDSNYDKIQALQNGHVPIYEPGLNECIKKSVDAGRLRFMCRSHPEPGSHPALDAGSSIVFIAVGTPSLESGDADLSYIYDATLRAAENHDKDTLIVIKSTVPPGTCQKLQLMLRERGFEHEIASNPEFLREGSAIEDFLKPDRIVIGISSDRAGDLLSKVYKSLTDKGFPILATDTTTAELIKYASNSFLATKIAFINEMANLCEKVGANVEMLSKAMGMDHRIGSAFLKAGPGFGGSCFPKDLLALSYLAHEHNQPCHVLDAVIFSNKNRSAHMARKIQDVIGDLKGRVICVLGITFKAGTDDVRSSPAVAIINILTELGAEVRVYDPEGAKGGMELVSATFCNDAYDAVLGAEAIVILTEWEEFKALDFRRIAGLLVGKNIFDFRNILDGDSLKKMGFNYHKIGMPVCNRVA